jgi:hypothetical protein
MGLMIRPGIWGSVLAAGVLAASAAPLLGVEALTFPLGPASGTAVLVYGGAGWSFSPTTNLTVTSVGYLGTATGGDPNAVVTIWAGTNSAIASYTPITDPSAQPNEIVSAPVPPLLLAAGQTYSITVYAAPLSGSQWYGSVHDNSGFLGYAPFEVAPELSNYHALSLNQDGTFAPLSSDPAQDQQLLCSGPTFTYAIGLPPPTLQIALASNNNVLLSWPTNAVGYVLQSSAAAMGTYTSVTNAPILSGVNYLTTLPRSRAGGFFRLMKPS